MLTHLISEFSGLSEEDQLKVLLHYQNSYENDLDDQIDDATFDAMVVIYEKGSGKKYKVIGAAPVTKNKVTLPYFMGSLDKIKGADAKTELNRWLKTYTGNWIIEDKIDGISGLYVVRYVNGKKIVKLYTRGDGEVGTDITNLLEYIEIPVPNFDIVVRGELVISYDDFEAYTRKNPDKNLKNARNSGAGVVNSKEVNVELARLMKFFAYNIVDWGYDSINQEMQLKYLEGFGFDTPWHMKAENLTVEALEEALKIRKKEAIYDIDGIVVADNKVYPLESGRNPRHMFAFKVDSFIETTVIDVIWEASKDGILKPIVLYEPVNISGVTLSRATGKNAKFIVTRKIGPGALILITRAGDVIPDIVECIIPAKELRLPNEEFHWNETEVEFVLDNIEDNDQVRKERLRYFFTQLDIKNFGPGRIDSFYEAGYDSIESILSMSIEDITKIPGFKIKSAEQIYNSIHLVANNAPLANVMAGSGIFGVGFGVRRMEFILEEYPNILELSTLPRKELAEMIRGINGFDVIADVFAEKLPKFVKWLENNPMIRLVEPEASGAKTSSILEGMKIVFTGFRDSDLENKIKMLGGSVSTSISKNTSLLVAKDLSDLKGKGAKAQELGVPIITLREFKNQYGL